MKTMPLSLLLVCVLYGGYTVKGQGTLIGSFKLQAHEVAGNVYAVDNKRIYIKDFTYDGKGPDAFFYVGTSGEPSHEGQMIPDKDNSMEVLRRYNKEDFVLTLPNNLQLKDLRWLSVWCRQFRANFGHVMIPSNLLIPASVDLGELSPLAHGVSSGTVTVLDQRRMLIRNLRYDGQGPDAFFWVGTSGTPSRNGIIIPDENGSTGVLKAYSGKAVTLTLPEGQSWKDYKWLSLWCRRATQDFGNVQISGVENVPPYFPTVETDMANCETLHDHLNVAWEIKNDKIVVELTGALDTSSGYMSFGISGSDSASLMIEGDVAVASYLGEPKVEDYFLQGKAFCSGSTGVCKDTNFGGESQTTLLSGSFNQGITTVRYERPLQGSGNTDKSIPASGDVYVIWALGKLNNFGAVTRHDVRTPGNLKLNFGRSGQNNCRPVKPREKKTVDAWNIPALMGDKQKTIIAQMGPAGGDQGYTAITGQQSWGIAWYLNGLLIPQLVVKRGETFTFKVYGGNNDTNTARYHPFYITDDSVGGYAAKSEDEKKGIKIYAGLTGKGDATVGPYCEYKSGKKNGNEYTSFDAYAKTFDRVCDKPSEEPGMFTWTPDASTPDKLYYQCYTHQYLGWEVHVVNDYADFMSTASYTNQISMLLVTAMVFLGAVL